MVGVLFCFVLSCLTCIMARGLTRLVVLTASLRRGILPSEGTLLLPSDTPTYVGLRPPYALRRTTCF